MRRRTYFFPVLLLVLSFFLHWAAAGWAESNAVAIPRLRYSGGGDWYTDPTTIPNLLRAASDRFNLSTRPENFAIQVTDADLFKFPIVYLTGHGNVKFSDEEISKLISFFDNGGFLWIDDCYGLDKSIRREIKRMFPDQELVLLPSDHPIFHMGYEFPKGMPKIHEHDGKAPCGYAIFNKGRMVIFYSYETDLGDGMEDEGVHPEDPPEIREKAMQMGLNILLFALSQ
jgi:hypothetical protein